MMERLIVVGVIAVVWACAPPQQQRARENPNLITAEEIEASRANTVYEAITRLRPAFIRSRGQTTINLEARLYPEVYLNGQRYGEIEHLRSFPAEGVRAIRYYSAIDATTRYGSGHTAGVIEVLTR